MKVRVIVFLVFIISLVTVNAQNSPEHDLIISVDRIWDRAAHNAFTSLIEFNGKLYCTFRESNGHVSDINGTIRVIASEDDGQNWYSVAHIFEKGVDLRDPQLSVTPDKRIMLNIGGSIYTNSELAGMKPKVGFSDKNGEKFSKPENVVIDKEIKSDKDWLWRATWHKGRSYATIYQPSKEKSVQLIVSDDGINYKYIATFDVPYGNETTLRFTNDDRIIAVVRTQSNGYIGNSDPPYKNWEWSEFEFRIGGPDLILLKDGTMLCAAREYPPDHKEKTILAKVDLNGDFIKLLTLPSGGDCSYAGLVMKDSILYVSYYSTHEEKTAIYLAKILDLKYGYESFERIGQPVVVSDKNGLVQLSCEDENATIRYTIDGSIPSAINGYTYEKPLKVSKTTLLRTVTVKYKYPNSNILSHYVGTDLYQEAQVIKRDLNNGLNYKYFEGEVKSTKEIEELTLYKTGIISNITNSMRHRDYDHAIIFNGYLKIPEDGVYNFYLTSNDGSRLHLNDELAINNDGAHGSMEESITVSLKSGYHKILVEYFQLGGGKELMLEWSSENIKREEIPRSYFYH
ncbi:MAG: PA14 domain-containing protein [Bacteroidota bacterium]